jgi:hypothetical protein
MPKPMKVKAEKVKTEVVDEYKRFSFGLYDVFLSMLREFLIK